MGNTELITTAVVSILTGGGLTALWTYLTERRKSDNAVRMKKIDNQKEHNEGYEQLKQRIVILERTSGELVSTMEMLLTIVEGKFQDNETMVKGFKLAKEHLESVKVVIKNEGITSV